LVRVKFSLKRHTELDREKNVQNIETVFSLCFLLQHI